MAKYYQSANVRLTQFICGLLLLFNVTSASAFTPENGWWWNQQESGRGFNLEIQNGTVFLATFIYNEAGNAIWYSGSGKLNADNTITLDLVEFANGQCIQCTHQGPDVVGTVESATIRFSSSSTAELNWTNGTVPLQRFNFNLGESRQQQLIGEWALVAGNSSLPAYTGDRITLTGLQQSDTLDVIGYRTGNTNAKISIFDATASPIKGYTLSAFMSTNLSTLRAYAFNLSGLNRIEGITVDVSSNASAEEITQALTTQGVPFIGFRL
ncbi:MAG: hypothetical protein V3U88_11235 [Methylococcales bacterium]